ncbi:hypothetical protein [Qingshengfaniella alkalisoli]|uniref:hypothetical protein n=1 Tax=Qingshengfaniella alkalisoli TaxID=2599296 RepID=UPI00143D8604|nr:hypothetical protein [Qingshengfaniella alkalisoli]
MNKLMAFLAFATLAGFLGILAYHVTEIDLWVVIGFTILLVAIDFVSSVRSKR